MILSDSSPRQRLRKGPDLPYKVVAGVVPARGGWVVASAKLQGVTLSPEEPVRDRTLIEVLDTKPSFSIVALGAPIGLRDHPDEGPRDCDRAARDLLGWPRAATLIDPPVRSVLAARDYEAARLANGGQLSMAQWRRVGRLREIDAELAPYWQRTVFEVHPELSFFELNGGRPLRHAKHTLDGIAERTAILATKLPWLDRILGASRKVADTPSLLDATACLWASRRIMARAVHHLPQFPVWDSTGLRMEKVF